jgi:hypothetical protein
MADAMTGIVEHQCGHCRASDARYAIRTAGEGEWTAWLMPLMPTGARVSAYLCAMCLNAVVLSEVQAIRGFTRPAAQRTGKRSAMLRLLSRLKASRS